MDDLLDDLDAGEPASLRLADELGVEALLRPEKIDVQHNRAERRRVDGWEEGGFRGAAEGTTKPYFFVRYYRTKYRSRYEIRYFADRVLITQACRRRRNCIYPSETTNFHINYS